VARKREATAQKRPDTIEAQIARARLEPGDPWVLVTCSTDYLPDERLATTAVQALRDEPVRVLVTLADAYDGHDWTTRRTCASNGCCRTPPRSWGADRIRV